MLSDLPKIHSFYKFSLEAFIIVMNRSIDKISENKLYSGDLMDPYGEEEHAEFEEEDEEISSPVRSPTKKDNKDKKMTFDVEEGK
jgi:dynein heavy chain